MMKICEQFLKLQQKKTFGLLFCVHTVEYTGLDSTDTVSAKIN